MTIAQQDLELLDWLVEAARSGGGFVSAVATAGLYADFENYPLMRPLLLVLKKKYPDYDRKQQEARQG